MIEAAAELIRDASYAIALTGAGISVDSGISDFRSPGGLWERFDPVEYASIYAFLSNPEKVWRMIGELHETLKNARPNAGHLALARLEEIGRLKAIITQNIDNLHQLAGSQNVVEFHGNSTWLVCLSCGKRVPVADFEDPTEIPRCSCGRVLKPDAVFFGEMIPPKTLARAMAETQKSDLVLVVGTSATVAPASGIPYVAKEGGAKIIEINKEATPVTAVADVSLFASASTALPAIVERLSV